MQILSLKIWESPENLTKNCEIVAYMQLSHYLTTSFLTLYICICQDFFVSLYQQRNN